MLNFFCVDQATYPSLRATKDLPSYVKFKKFLHKLLLLIQTFIGSSWQYGDGYLLHFVRNDPTIFMPTSMIAC